MNAYRKIEPEVLSRIMGEKTYSEEGADWYDYDTGHAVAVLGLVPWLCLAAIWWLS